MRAFLSRGIAFNSRCGKVIAAALLLAVLLVACQREQRPLGGAANEVLDEPDYTVVAQLAAPAGPAYVTDVAPKLAKAELDPAELYTKACAACHQPTGQGIPGVFPPLAQSEYVIGDNTARLASIMLYGLTGPIEVLGTQYNNVMAPLGGQFSDEELAKIASYVRSSWGNSAPPVEAEVFTNARQKWGTRGPFQITELNGDS